MTNIQKISLVEPIHFLSVITQTGPMKFGSFLLHIMAKRTDAKRRSLRSAKLRIRSEETSKILNIRLNLSLLQN